MPATPAFVPSDLSQFEFPPRLPLIQSNPYEEDSELNGFPSHSSRLLWALDRSVLDLAIELYLVDQGEHICRASPYANQVPEVVYGHLTNIVFTTSVQFLRLALKQQLHTCFKSPNDKSLRLPNDAMSYSQSKEISGVYSLVHCKADGTTPSKNEYLQILERMEEYNTTQFSKQEVWKTADKNAAEIDSASPEIEERKWKGATTGSDVDNWMNGEHPPRYDSDSELSEKEICRFIEKFRERLDCIDDASANEPIPWSISYVGWASPLDSRRDEHLTHSHLGSAIAYLLEATSHVVFPSARYFLRFLPLIYAGDIGDAIYAEHTWSLIVGSYTWYGGLNGVMGGDKGMETRLQRQSKKETFQNGLDLIVLQGHVPERYQETEQRLENMKFYAEFAEPRSEFKKVEAVIRHRVEAEEELNEGLKRLGKAQAALIEAKIKRFETYREVAAKRNALEALKALPDGL